MSSVDSEGCSSESDFRTTRMLKDNELGKAAAASDGASPGGAGDESQTRPVSDLSGSREPKSEAGNTVEHSGSTMVNVSLYDDKCAPNLAADKRADIECGTSGPKKPPALMSLRYYMMLLALVSPFIVTYSRTIINFAIIDMIDSSYLRQKQAANQPVAQSATLITANGSVAARTEYFDLDNSCPVNELVRERLLNELASDERRAHETKGEKFQWDTDKQGLLKAAYSIGHMLLQVAGGRFSEIYGSQFVMSLSSCLMAFCCLLAPFLASVHFYLLFADLFMLGILGSFMTPSLITLISNWLTPSEKSITMSFYLVSSRLGYALSSLLCGLLIDAQLSWRYLFYSAGWVSLGFSNVFFVCCRNRPQEHPLMSAAELEYLASKNTLVREALARREEEALQEETELKPIETKEHHDDKRQQAGDKQSVESSKGGAKDPRARPPAPWLAILTNVPVWAFIVTKFCVKLMGDTVQIELPVYLKRVMHMESKYNGYINSANYVIFCISCVAVGTLAKLANKRRPFGWTKTTVRKIFQCTASFGVSLILLAVSLSVCNETATLGLFMAMFVLTTFSSGGEAQIPLDLSERYAGTIHALGGTLAISGAIEPIMVGQFLLGHSADKARWANIWMGASAISFLGGLIFLTLGEAKIQPFDELAESSDKKTKGGEPVEANGRQQHKTKATLDDGKSGQPLKCDK